ncbi:MAG: hypothetical protein HRU38_13655 [Saccharospirillaceae bacterium]|nr:hypothetical protein [Pseudomonadales bacterium]NRB79690.1 hypothetical protein [Saccharospirillaceae bacterium]
MKITSTLILIASVTLSLLVNAAEPLPMPQFEQTPETLTLTELESEIPKLNRAVGAYPAMFYNVNHKMQVYKSWTNLLGATLILKPNSKIEATRKVHLIATLFVQGYNMNVIGAADKAHDAIDFCLKVAPQSTQCHLLSAMFYMSADVEKLDDVKHTLDNLQTTLGKNKHADVEIALAYYYVYANDYNNALTQIELVEVFFEDLKHDSIKKYRLKQLREMKAAILDEQAKIMKKEIMQKKK